MAAGNTSQRNRAEQGPAVTRGASVPVDKALLARKQVELKEAVAESFALRQRLQRFELAGLERQLEHARQTLEQRSRSKEQIIDRRVSDLLNPDPRWEQGRRLRITKANPDSSRPGTTSCDNCEHSVAQQSASLHATEGTHQLRHSSYQRTFQSPFANKRSPMFYDIQSSRSVAVIVMVVTMSTMLTARWALAIRGELDSPAVAFPADYPDEARKQVAAALEREDCEFLRGHFFNAKTTIHYAGETSSLNSQIGDLLKCPEVTLTVRFKKLNDSGDWLLLHDAGWKPRGSERLRSNGFEIQINLDSKRIDLEKLILPTMSNQETREISSSDSSSALTRPPLSPETILESEFEGKATVVLQVGDVRALNIDSIFVPDVSHALVVTARTEKTHIGQEVVVTVSREVATRLLKLGIEDPTEYFRGKLLRVSGRVERIGRPSPSSAMVYRIQVTNLDQLESIRKP